ncbi:MAG: radical SAM protein [Bacillota bacterium]|nr:radical SAM protein [Bacillota bacterium]MDW7684661.1 radical SAM protein [Bacillota bacterium]
MRYEQPLFRPPSEAYSLILQVTIGCSHNACGFCSMYKGKKFRVKSLEEIRGDIRVAKERYGAVERIFLADGDALAMETDDLLAVLQELREAFPAAERVSLYAGPKNILTKSDEELAAIREAGVGLAYFGIESGDGQILAEIKKGATSKEMAESGRKIRRAGIALSATMILGLGGKERWREHALATAEVASDINPEYLAALTLMVDKKTPLGRRVEQGDFVVPAAGEILAELKLLLENLTVDNCLFRSNHASNYFAVGGRLPQDREKMLVQVKRALGNQGLLKAEMFRGL